MDIRKYITCDRCHGDGESPDSNGSDRYPCELCGGSGQVLHPDTTATYTLVDADGRMLAIDEREIAEPVDERLSLIFWHIDGEMYDLMPSAYTVVQRGVSREAAFAACRETMDEGDAS